MPDILDNYLDSSNSTDLSTDLVGTWNRYTNALAAVDIDSSVLERLSHSRKPSTLDSSISPSPTVLTQEESRAALLVLLNKFLLADAGVRADLPLLIQKNLNGAPEAWSLSTAFQGVAVSREEKSAFETSLVDLNGLFALIDCSASALVPLIDAIAALSCEAISADVRAFDLLVSADGFSVTDETDVASDMRDLLFGSNFVGTYCKDAVGEIPEVHGSFRGVARAVHLQARTELNSKVGGKEKALVATVLPLTLVIRTLGEITLERAKLTLDAIGEKLKSELCELLQKNCTPLFQKIRIGLQCIVAKVDSMELAVVLHE